MLAKSLGDKQEFLLLVDDYSNWHNRYIVRLGAEYDETYLEDMLIGVGFTDNDKVVGIWYNEAKFGTVSPKTAFEDLETYVDNDPYFGEAMAANNEVFHESLGSNQKKAGQLGPTKKVSKNGTKGKLVGETKKPKLVWKTATVERNQDGTLTTHKIKFDSPGEAALVATTENGEAIITRDKDTNEYVLTVNGKVHSVPGSHKCPKKAKELAAQILSDDMNETSELNSIIKLSGIKSK